VIAFAKAYDPQPFHVDEAAAKASMYGGLIASGWHTVAMTMRMMVDSYLGAFRPKPDVLFAAVTVARAAKDKMSEEKYSRALRLEFPDSAQARALKRGS